MSAITDNMLLSIGPPAPGGQIADSQRRQSQQRPPSGGLLPPALMHVFALAVSTGLAQDATVTVPGEPTIVPAAALQMLSGDGPCLLACETRLVTDVTDVATDRRWPAWAAAAAAAGVGSVLAVPFDTSSAAGSLNLWSRKPRTFDSGDLQTAADLAALAAALLDSAHHQENLLRAVDGRTVIGQAQGLLMEQYRLTPAAAFSALAGRSQALNRKLRAVAEELVATGELPQPGRHAPRRPVGPGQAPLRRSETPLGHRHTGTIHAEQPRGPRPGSNRPKGTGND